MKPLLFITSTFFIFQCSFSQISTTEIHQQIIPKKEKIILYDSLENLFDLISTRFDDISTSLKNKENLIGLELYLPAGNSTSEYFSSTNATNISNKYYTVLDVFGYKSDDRGKDMDVHFTNVTSSLKTPIILMVDKNSNDSVYLSLPGINNANTFVLVPYFQKLKQLFDNTHLICTYSNATQYDKETDIITNEKIRIEMNSRWLCNLLVTKLPGKNYYDSYFILKNENNQSIAFSCNSFITLINKDDFFSLTLEGIVSGYRFLTENQFAKRESLKKVYEEKEAKTSIVNIAKEKFKKDKYKSECIKKFGQVFGELVASKKVKIGMTEEMCELAWNKPYSINRTTLEDRVLETWHYSLVRNLFFVNGILKKIEE